MTTHEEKQNLHFGLIENLHLNFILKFEMTIYVTHISELNEATPNPIYSWGLKVLTMLGIKPLPMNF